MSGSYTKSGEKKRNKFASYSLLSRTRNKLYKKPGNTTTFIGDDTTMSSLNGGNITMPLHITTPNVSVNYANSSYYQKIINSSKVRLVSASDPIVNERSSFSTKKQNHGMNRSASPGDSIEVPSTTDARSASSSRFILPNKLVHSNTTNGDDLLSWMKNLKSKAEATLRSNRSEELKFYSELSSERKKLQVENSVKEEEFRKLGDFLLNRGQEVESSVKKEVVPEETSNNELIEEEEKTPLVDETQDISETEYPEMAPEDDYEVESDQPADFENQSESENDNDLISEKDSDLEIIELESGSEESTADAGFSRDPPITEDQPGGSSFYESNSEEELDESQGGLYGVEGSNIEDVGPEEDIDESDYSLEGSGNSQEPYNYQPYSDPYLLKPTHSEKYQESSDDESDSAINTDEEEYVTKAYNENDIETYSIDNTEEENAENEIDEMSVLGQASYQVSDALASTRSAEESDTDEEVIESQNLEAEEAYDVEMDEDDDFDQEQMAFQIDPALIATAVQRSLDMEAAEISLQLSSRESDNEMNESSNRHESPPYASSPSLSSSSSSSSLEESENEDANESILDPSLINLLEGSLVKHEEQAKLDASSGAPHFLPDALLQRKSESDSEASADLLLQEKNLSISTISLKQGLADGTADSQNEGDLISGEYKELSESQENSDQKEAESVLRYRSRQDLDIDRAGFESEEEEILYHTVQDTMEGEHHLDTFESEKSRVGELIDSILENEILSSAPIDDSLQANIIKDEPDAIGIENNDLDEVTVTPAKNSGSVITETTETQTVTSEIVSTETFATEIKEEVADFSSDVNEIDVNFESSENVQKTTASTNLDDTTHSGEPVFIMETTTHRSYSFTVTDVSDQKHIGESVQAESIEEPFDVSDSELQESLETDHFTEAPNIVEISEDTEHYSTLETVKGISSLTPSVSRTDFHQYFSNTRSGVDNPTFDDAHYVEDDSADIMNKESRESSESSENSEDIPPQFDLVASEKDLSNETHDNEKGELYNPQEKSNTNNSLMGEELQTTDNSDDFKREESEIINNETNNEDADSNIAGNTEDVDLGSASITDNLPVEPQEDRATETSHFPHHPDLEEVKDDEFKELSQDTSPYESEQTIKSTNKQGPSELSEQSDPPVSDEQVEGQDFTTPLPENDNLEETSEPDVSEKKRKREEENDQQSGVTKKLKQFTSFFGGLFRLHSDSPESDDIDEITVVSTLDDNQSDPKREQSVEVLNISPLVDDSQSNSISKSNALPESTAEFIETNTDAANVDDEALLKDRTELEKDEAIQNITKESPAKLGNEVQEKLASSPYLLPSSESVLDTEIERNENENSLIEVSKKPTTRPKATRKKAPKKPAKKPISAFAAVNKRLTRSSRAELSSDSSQLNIFPSDALLVKSETSSEGALVDHSDQPHSAALEGSGPNTNEPEREDPPDSLYDEASNQPKIEPDIQTENVQTENDVSKSPIRGISSKTLSGVSVKEGELSQDESSQIKNSVLPKGRRGRKRALPAETVPPVVEQTEADQTHSSIPLPKARAKRLRSSSSKVNQTELNKNSRVPSVSQKHITMRTRSGRYIGANTSVEIASAEEQEKLEELLISEVASGDIRANTSVSEVAQNYDEEEIKRQLRSMRENTIVEEKEEDEEEEKERAKEAVNDTAVPEKRKRGRPRKTIATKTKKKTK